MKHSTASDELDRDLRFDEHIEIGAAIASELARELILPHSHGRIRIPRYLSWHSTREGLIVVTDRASRLVAPEDWEDFCPVLIAMVRPEFGACKAGNC